ncbi:MAG TPA: class I SAM-dependent methyltransferase [Candidatus Nanoarchaeia archaeon]|nr:class I SAM-dependent methyltransferase [Candidatus Nanoarchaeia archaeon]
MKSPIKTIEGIPFYSEDRYWGKAPKEELENAISLIENEGWESFKKHYKNRFDFTFEENRADWRFVIPLSKSSKVLDAGAGMGRITIPLARVVNKVVSLDNSFLRLKYLKLRAKQEGLNNIEVLVGDIFDSPFEKESFDLIVMNGLLEWVGATTRYPDPRVAQIESLKICKGLLKKDGVLYIGIENRAALAYLRGADHLGIYYTSYMPRFLANWYTKLRKGRKYDTYTYTKAGYEKLLKEAGLTNYEFYLPYPGYNMPRVMIPYTNLDALAYTIQSLMSAKGKRAALVRLIGKSRLMIWIYRHFFFSYGIVVTK